MDDYILRPLELRHLDDCKVEPWVPGKYEKVKTLEEAARNKGSVDLMKEIETGGKVAVKRMPNSWVMSGPREFAKQQPNSSEQPWLDIAILKYLNGQGLDFVCDFHGTYSDPRYTYVVSSLATEGDLFGWAGYSALPGKGREALMRPIIIQVFSAVRCLHNLGIYHQDISLENILLTDEGDGFSRVKLIDFGMATFSRHSPCTKPRGKQTYQSPEMHNSTTADAEYDTILADSFALGVTIFAMAAHDYPWKSTRKGDCLLFDYIRANGFRQFLQRRAAKEIVGRHLVDLFSETLVDVLDGLLHIDPEKRFTLGETDFCGSRKSAWDTEWIGIDIDPASPVGITLAAERTGLLGDDVDTSDVDNTDSCRKLSKESKGASPLARIKASIGLSLSPFWNSNSNSYKAHKADPVL
jgi:serine/threonine protein kinase